MNLMDEIAKKESETLEFKAELPDDSLAFVKDIIAFSNGVGGLLVIGIKEGTREPVGVPDRDQQYVEERIANAVANMIEQQVIPVFSWANYKGKSVLIVTIRAGQEMPYHVKGKPLSEGTYIRIGPTTHLAKPMQIEELKRYGRVPYDKQRNYDIKITDEAVKKLCDELSAYRKRTFTKKDLITMQVIKEDAGIEYPTNAYALLTGDEPSMGSSHTVECAVFRGKEKHVFIDKASFRGPIYEQIESAHKFVIKSIKVGQWLPQDSIAMKDIFEVPTEAIRESIANAVCHRDYAFDNSSIFVAVYDDRIEVISPGILPLSTTMSNAMSGISMPRNQTLASVFRSAGITEGWGTGIRKIIKECRDYGLKDPTFEQRSFQFVVTLYRSDQYDPEKWYWRKKESEVRDSLMHTGIQAKTPEGLEGDELTVYNAILLGNGDTIDDLVRFTGISRSTVKRVLTKLKEKNIADREGNKRNGRYVLIVEPNQHN